MTNKKLVLILIIIFVLAILTGLGLSWVVDNSRQQAVKPNESNLQEIASGLNTEQQKVGDIGEVKIKDATTGQEEILQNANFPLLITSTVGKVIKIENGYLTLQGNGNSFADAQPREIKAKATEQTKVFDAQQKMTEGVTAINSLTLGQNVLVEGEGNIRGKTEFNLLTVNILNL
ncbi:MAG: hypothetical protein NTV62_04315 [Candidatus Gribaldobacteria bacterium]|nr:hypothetical protein [Candidatus Gribaldobacteria bacterium]